MTTHLEALRKHLEAQGWGEDGYRAATAAMWEVRDVAKKYRRDVVRRMVEQEAEARGTGAQKRVAKRLKVSHQHINSIVKGRR